MAQRHDGQIICRICPLCPQEPYLWSQRARSSDQGALLSRLPHHSITSVVRCLLFSEQAEASVFPCCELFNHKQSLRNLINWFGPLNGLQWGRSRDDRDEMLYASMLVGGLSEGILQPLDENSASGRPGMGMATSPTFEHMSTYSISTELGQSDWRISQYETNPPSEEEEAGSCLHSSLPLHARSIAGCQSMQKAYASLGQRY